MDKFFWHICLLFDFILCCLCSFKLEGTFVVDTDESPVEYPLDVVVNISGDKVPDVDSFFISINFNGSKNE